MADRIQLLEHVILSDRRTLSPEHAKYVLSLGFPKRNHVRYQKLAAKASSGSLTDKEQAELDEFLAADAMLTVLQSKARRALRKHTSAA